MRDLVAITLCLMTGYLAVATPPAAFAQTDKNSSEAAIDIDLLSLSRQSRPAAGVKGTSSPISSYIQQQSLGKVSQLPPATGQSSPAMRQSSSPTTGQTLPVTTEGMGTGSGANDGLPETIPVPATATPIEPPSDSPAGDVSLPQSINNAIDNKMPHLRGPKTVPTDSSSSTQQPVGTPTVSPTLQGPAVKDEPEKKGGPAMGVIRYDVEAPGADLDPALKRGVSIFKALDEALVKSPRASAIRSVLPISKSELARATEQPSPEIFFDRAIAAEQVRRIGPVFNWEPPWKLAFRLLVAKRMVDQQKLELMAQLWQLRAEVRMSYTEVVVAQETLETLNSLYNLAHRLKVVSEKRFQAGDVPELDLLKARLAESQYDVERRVGLRRVIRAKQELNVIMGRTPEQTLSIPRLPPFLRTRDLATAETAKHPLLPDFTKQLADLDEYVNLAMLHRYELKTIYQQISVNKANMMRAIGDIAPTGQFWIGSSVAGNPPTGPKLSAYYFGFNVPTNITSFQQGDIAKFKALGRQLRYQTEAQKNVITQDVCSAYNNVLAARTKLRYYEEHVLADSYEVARLARRSYEVGQSDITSTIQAQQQNVQIRTQYLEAIQLYQQAFTALERACGTPLLEER